MAYTWTDGELITAEKLNQTGGGSGLVVNVTIEKQGMDTTYTMDKTMGEILDAFENGDVIVKMNDTETKIWKIFLPTEARPIFGVPVNVFIEMIFIANSLNDYPTYTEGGQS